jgi:hypothetical protein
MLQITDKMAFCGKALNKLHMMIFSIFVFKLKDKIVLNYLKANYGNFIKNYKCNLIPPKKNIKSPIFCCWLQGEENAPRLVKICIESIKKHSNGHDVIIISEKNVCDYVDIPAYILENLHSGKISRTFFSDIVRVALLASYGGMWIDATFFLTQDLPDDYFEHEIFSAAKQPEPKGRRGVCISKFRWTGSFIGAKNSNHILFCFLRDFFYEYEKKEIVNIDYLLVDYLIFIAFENFPQVHNDIKNIPDNNLDFGWLFHAMNKPFDKNKQNEMFNGSTFCYKLSYKIKWKLFRGKKETYYNHFLNGEKN